MHNFFTASDDSRVNNPMNSTTDCLQKISKEIGNNKIDDPGGVSSTCHHLKKIEPAFFLPC